MCTPRQDTETFAQYRWSHGSNDQNEVNVSQSYVFVCMHMHKLKFRSCRDFHGFSIVLLCHCCDTKFFSSHCFFTNSGQKPDKPDNSDKKDKMDEKDADSTVALETGKHLM